MKFAELEIVKMNVNDIITASEEVSSAVSSDNNDMGEEELD